MRNYYYIIPLFFLLWNFVPSFARQNSDFEIIRKRVFDEYQNSPNTKDLDEEVNKLLASISSNGSWEDINYSDKSMTGWKPDIHIKRLGKLAKAYSRSNSSLYQNPELYETIISGMKYWTSLEPAPKSDNWWWLSISVPQEIGRLLIAMRFAEPTTPSDLEEAMLEWMNKTVSITTAPGKDGSNLTDIAQHMIMQAVLIEDSELLNSAVSVTSESIKVTQGDGIQRDGSFHAHGPELYMHGYGREYLSGIRNVAVFTVGTSYSFSPDQIALISDFARNGYLQSMRGRYIDFSVIGRGIARNNATRTNSSLVKQLEEIDIEEHKDEYQNAIDRIEGKQPPSYQIKPRNIHYWRSDYTVHHRPEFMVSVNIASSRTIRTESGNNENLNGQWLTEGATNIAVKGDEYFNIFPNWEWNKIPGTTTPENKKLRKRTNWVAELGNADFVGGVSDGLNGVTVYKMDDYKTKAKKAWFFFEDKIICLGAEISADRPENINTTVNQSRLRGSVSIAGPGDFKVLDAGYSEFSKDLNWIFHDDIGYYFPTDQNIVISTKDQPGSWREINGNSSNKPIQKDIFKVYINHGLNPKNAKYSYVLLPGVETPEELKAKTVSEIEILSNDGKVQAVEDKSNSLLGFVFYEKGNFEWEGNELTVNQPCLVQIQEGSDGKWKVSLAEPTQLLKGSIQVTLKIDGKSKSINFDLPKDDFAGSTISQTIDIG
ncbi:polysaccharide lyase 8 family protein [Algoriphagus sp.]|uniref:polysaccharide lyase 8 family protein n=1 Tax=Algoriphagus sp. TaxID=1872435 RepID=UPI0025D76517|nr:polysaccharide lyase 8 family protein [Algoriphagus sp.]